MDLAHAVDPESWQRRPFALRYSLPADHGRWQRRLTRNNEALPHWGGPFPMCG
jgi:hypothetical protein